MKLDDAGRKLYLLPKRIATICHNLPHFQQSATNLQHAYPFVLQRDIAPLWQIGRFSWEKTMCTRVRVTLLYLYIPPFTPWLLKVFFLRSTWSTWRRPRFPPLLLGSLKFLMPKEYRSTGVLDAGRGLHFSFDSLTP